MLQRLTRARSSGLSPNGAPAPSRRGAPPPGPGSDAAPAEERGGEGKAAPGRSGGPKRPKGSEATLPPGFDLPPSDPLHAHLLGQAGAVDISRLSFPSPALAALREAGMVLVVPLISSGELIGLLSLGPRLSERGYSSEDRRLLTALAGYAAPAMRVGQLVRQQQAQARSAELTRLDEAIMIYTDEASALAGAVR